MNGNCARSGGIPELASDALNLRLADGVTVE